MLLRGGEVIELFHYYASICEAAAATILASISYSIMESERTSQLATQSTN